MTVLKHTLTNYDIYSTISLMYLLYYWAASQRGVYCYTPSSVVSLRCVSVLRCLSVGHVRNIAEPIEMPFGVLSRVGPRDHVLQREGAFLGE